MAYKHPLLSMKKSVILSLVCFCFFSIGQAQKITKNEVDKFSKIRIIETSNETLYSSYAFTLIQSKFDFSIRKVDQVYAMTGDIYMSGIAKYTEDDGITFLLDNDETVKLTTNYTGLGSKYIPQGRCHVFRTSFNLSADDVSKLKAHKVLAIRITYLGGAYDRDLKKNKQDIIMKALKLVDKQ